MNKTIPFNDCNNQYLRSKDNIGICLDNTKSKIIVLGSNALNLINYLSINTFTSSDKHKFIIFYKRKFLDEVLVFRINPNKYLLIVNCYDIVMKYLKRYRKKFPLTVVVDASSQYSYFTFHGKLKNQYFSEFKLKYLFTISHQGYFYYHLITSKEDEKMIHKHFISNKFINITVETKRIFLYNNVVIPNFNKISKKYVLPLINAKYNPEEFSVHLYDILDYQALFKNTKVYNYLGRNVGLVYSTFTQPGYYYFDQEFSKLNENQNNLVCLVVTQSNDDILYVKHNNHKKKDILIKKRL